MDLPIQFQAEPSLSSVAALNLPCGFEVAGADGRLRSRWSRAKLLLSVYIVVHKKQEQEAG